MPDSLERPMGTKQPWCPSSLTPDVFKRLCDLVKTRSLFKGALKMHTCKIQSHDLPYDPVCGDHSSPSLHDTAFCWSYGPFPRKDSLKRTFRQTRSLGPSTLSLPLILNMSHLEPLSNTLWPWVHWTLSSQRHGGRNFCPASLV